MIGTVLNEIVKTYKMFTLENPEQMFSYDLDSWTKVKLPEMKIARANFTTILVGKYIYVFGGLAESKALKSCER